MIRKTLIAFAAVATVAGAALAPTSASAWGFHHHHRHWGFGLGIIDVAPVADCYLVEKINKFGQVRVVQVCN